MDHPLVDQLQAVETDGVTPMAHPLDHGQRLRSDEVTEIDEHAHIQLNAPHVKRGHYLVPKVIEYQTLRNTKTVFGAV